MLLRRREFSSFINRLILHQSIVDLITGLVFLASRVVVRKTVHVGYGIWGYLACRLIVPDASCGA